MYRLLKDLVFNAPEEMAEPLDSLLLSFLFKKVIHVRRESGNEIHCHIKAVVPDVVVGGDVIKMLAGSDLAGDFAGHCGIGLFHEPDESVQLACGDECVHGVREEDHVRFLQGFLCGCEVFLKGVDP